MALGIFLLLLSRSVLAAPIFPSMIFFENSTLDGKANYTEDQLHHDQVQLAGHYNLAIAGWGEDSDTPPVKRHEEAKLANISALIKVSYPGTVTAVYAGQFELVDPAYDLQREIIEQEDVYGGMFMKNDHGEFLAPNGGMRIWDFRNQSAIDWHTKMVTGYFATNASGVDAVFFDEGDSFACQYDCRPHDTCKTMPSALEWHQGAIRAWVGAAKIMAQNGKRAILSSQNAFKSASPELWKERKPKGCPVPEDEVAAQMKAEGVPYMRFYEYFLVPEQFHGGSNPYPSGTSWLPGPSKGQTWHLCRNQIANAIEEGLHEGINFVGAATSAWPFANRTQRVEALRFHIAAFLIARSRVPFRQPHDRMQFTDYFGFDWQGHTAECPHTRWGDCAHSWEEVEAEYARDYGVPLTDAQEVSMGRFVRAYSKVNITVDCGTTGVAAATYDWLD